MSINSTDMGSILAAIRSLESGNYGAKPSSPGGASGAYQYIQSTWLANGGGAYAQEAYLATPAQQDAVATRNVQSILSANGGDIEAIPSIWYLGHIPSQAELDQVPHPEAGNKLTVRQYINKWIAAFTGGATNNNPLTAAKQLGTDAASAAAAAVTGALGDLVSPFVKGLQRLTIIGMAVLLGVGLIGTGAWRAVKPS